MNWLSDHASEIIAVCALVFTIWQTRVQRLHNRISVKPHLFMFTQKDKFKNSARIQVLFTNNGLGPAFINKFQVFLNGQESEPKIAVDAVLGILTNNSAHTILGEDCAMAQNEVKIILSVAFTTDSWQEIELIEKKINQLDLLVHYSSAYGQKYVLDTRSN
tara:strand:+ start:1346 stop:1828 length:483 start_codon:yes stop_codon:yes gene_type:complete